MPDLKEIPFQPSTIETIDFAVYDWLNETMNIFTTTNQGWKKVNIVWASAERAMSAKKTKEARDKTGTLNYPLITIERTSMVKDPTKRGTAWANIPPENDVKGGSITIARRINQDKTANFVNAETKIKRKQLNFPRKSNKVVYETVTIPMPVYVTVTYKIGIKTQYQQQINEMITPFITKPGGVNYQIIKRDEHRFEMFIQSDFAQNNNVSSMGTEERTYETSVEIKVLGYLIGEDKNQESPKIVIRENAVDIKFPRERVVTEDSPEWKNASGYVGITNIKGLK